MKETLTGAQALIRALEHENVEVMFGLPGGCILPAYDPLLKSSMRHVLVRHEQGAGHMAEGYAHVTGRPGVAMVTSGPAATNLVTPLCDAYMDSIPMVGITGQVPTAAIGTDAFQECDTVGITRSITKHNELVMSAQDLPMVVRQAFHIATTGRPGPTLIDIPKDVLQNEMTWYWPSDDEVLDSLPGYRPNVKGHTKMIKEAARLILAARQPILYVGGGVLKARAAAALRELAELTQIPVVTTLMARGAFPDSHPLCLGMPGMHGTATAVTAMQKSDLLIALGARFDDRITGAIEKFAPDATIVHVDIDRSEHHKNKFADYPIHSDVRYALSRLTALAKKRFRKPDLKAWYTTINGWKKQHPFPFSYDHSKTKHILPQEAVQVLFEESKGKAIISTGVGQHQMWAPQYYHFDEPRAFVSSLGAGTMGFGLPAAIGAKVARPDREVIDIDGDGSFLMNIQELACMKIEKINAKVLLLNNQHLGMVVQWEDRFYAGVRGHTILGDAKNIGSPDNPSGLYPDFVKIAQGFGIKARQVMRREDLREAIREMLAHDGPYLLDVIVPYTEHVLPFIPQKKSAMEILTD